MTASLHASLWCPANELLPELCGLAAHAAPCFEDGQDDPLQCSIGAQKAPDVPFKDSSGTLGNDQTESATEVDNALQRHFWRLSDPSILRPVSRPLAPLPSNLNSKSLQVFLQRRATYLSPGLAASSSMIRPPCAIRSKRRSAIPRVKGCIDQGGPSMTSRSIVFGR